MKKLLLALSVPLLLSGCSTTFTNLTPRQQVRNATNLYPVEVAFSSSQQTLRWNSINPEILVGSQAYPMRPTALMTNRWEGLVPMPQGINSVQYRYKFDYEVNSFGKPKPDSKFSPEYTLRIIDEKKK